jgi:hypothetical protein
MLLCSSAQENVQFEQRMDSEESVQFYFEKNANQIF